MSPAASKIVELRQYTLKPGHRDALIELFEREFVESQEAVGTDIIGTFRDADHPDRFVWLRGFPDMDARAKSLAAFYGGPVWQAHREAANATMLDSDNVLLLRPAWDGAGFAAGGTRAPVGATAVPEGMIVAAICYFREPVTADITGAFRDAARAPGSETVAVLTTEHAPNNFPRLPVREGENVLVWFSHFPDVRSAPASPQPHELKHLFTGPPEYLRLLPTARSRLHA
jgi:hypothetical protein